MINSYEIKKTLNFNYLYSKSQYCVDNNFIPNKGDLNNSNKKNKANEKFKYFEPKFQRKTTSLRYGPSCDKKLFKQINNENSTCLTI